MSGKCHQGKHGIAFQLFPSLQIREIHDKGAFHNLSPGHFHQLARRFHGAAGREEIIDHQTAPWGVKVTLVELNNIDLPQEMQRAMAKQAEAERERRAKILKAEGEFQAAQKLTDAAAIMGKESITLQLRYLETLRDISSENNSTILFPFPIEFLDAFKKKPA